MPRDEWELQWQRDLAAAIADAIMQLRKTTDLDYYCVHDIVRYKITGKMRPYKLARK